MGMLESWRGCCPSDLHVLEDQRFVSRRQSVAWVCDYLCTMTWLACSLRQQRFYLRLSQQFPRVAEASLSQICLAGANDRGAFYSRCDHFAFYVVSVLETTSR